MFELSRLVRVKIIVFFLVRDGLYRNPCVSVCVCICVFSVFRIVNETSTKASLAPAIDQLLYTNN